MRTPLKLLAAIISTTLLTIANTHAATNEQALEGWPDWIVEAMVKEAEPMTLQAVKTSDDSFSSKLPGKPGTPEAFDGGWYFPSDIGSESPLECYVWDLSMDLASLTNIMANSTIEGLAAEHGAVSSRTVFHVDAGEAAGMPYLALEWLYIVQGETQPSAAFTKVRAATKGEMSFACAHSYLGYRETLTQAFVEFVSNAVYEDASPVPYYEEIAKIEMGGLDASISHTQYIIDEDGDIEMQHLESMIMAVDSSTIMTNDSYATTYTRPDGALINAYSSTVENGEPSSQLALERGDNDEWISSGTMQGKEIRMEIDGALTPSSELEQIAIAKNLFIGDATSVSTLIWVASIDPTNFMETTITRDDSEVPQQAVLTLGPLSITGTFDADGNMENAKMVVGPATISIRRIWTTGSFAR